MSSTTLSVSSIVTHFQSLPNIGNLNAVTLVSEGVNFVKQFTSVPLSEKKKLLVAAFEHIAVGKDGVAGTADDVIPADIVAKVKLLLENQLMDHLVDALANPSAAVASATAAVSSCFPCFR